MSFYLTLSFLRCEVFNKRTLNLFKGSGNFGILFGWIEKYKLGLSKLHFF